MFSDFLLGDSGSNFKQLIFIAREAVSPFITRHRDCHMLLPLHPWIFSLLRLMLRNLLSLLRHRRCNPFPFLFPAPQ